MDSLAKLLTGKDNKIWIRTAWRQTMGNASKCLQGVSYRFYRNGDLIITRCVGGQRKSETQKWRIKRMQDDIVLIAGGVTYVMRPAVQQHRQEIKLRSRVTSKLDESEMIVLKHEEDD